MDTNKHVTELLSIFIDGVCSPEEKRQVEEHVAGCAQCRRDLADLQRTVKLVSQLEEIEPPEDLWEGIEKKITRKPFWEIFGLKPVPAAVIAMAVLLIAVSINKYTSNMTSQVKTEIPGSLAPLANIPVRGLEKSLAIGRIEKKKVVPGPALASNEVREKTDNYSLTPAKDSCGATAVSEMKSELVGQEVRPAGLYEIEMQVDDREKSFRQVEELANNHHANKLGQKDRQELFLQMQEEQFKDFVNDLNRVGRLSQPTPYLGAEPVTIPEGATTTPKMIRIKFNSPR